MPMKRSAAATTTLLMAAILVGGCSALSGLNPLREKDEILPGERRAALPQGSYEVAGGTPSIGSAQALADWSQPGGNAANAPGNVSLAGTSAASSWLIADV